MIDRVLVLVLDGMRADLLGPQATPHLWALRQRGQLFTQARSVFPSYTRVCTASVMAGALPAAHGVVGNAFHHPIAGDAGTLFLDRVADLRRLIAAEGAAILAPTIDQILARAGRRLAIVNGNSAGTAWLMLPDPSAGGHWVFNPHGRDSSAMPQAWDEVVARFGAPPPASVPLLARTQWLGRVFAEHVLGVIDPDVALMWLAEPDTSLHYLGTGQVAAALHAADAAVGQALAAVEAVGRLQSTAVLVFSDHGQISCPHHLPLATAWADLGIGLRPAPGIEALAVPGRCGGITLLPGGERQARLRVLAARLQARPEIGMVFSRDGEEAIPGSFAYALLGLDHPRAPDLVFVLADDGGADAAGLPGRGWTVAGDVPVGGGMHGGLHPAELGNLLMLALPGGVAATRDTPAGLVDIAPTVLALLGLEVPASMSGRDLAAPDPVVAVRRHTASAGRFGQYLETAQVGGAIYPLAGGSLVDEI